VGTDGSRRCGEDALPSLLDRRLDEIQSVMAASYSDALVTDYERIASCLDLPDPDDELAN